MQEPKYKCGVCGAKVEKVSQDMGWVHSESPMGFGPHDVTLKVIVDDNTKPNPEGEFNLLEMLTGDVNRLRYISRHSTSLVMHRENVAEHSYYVALYGLMICRWVNRNINFIPVVREVEEHQVLVRCLVHDIDESRTGDFQRPFKYRSEELRKQIEQASALEFFAAIKPILNDDSTTINSLCHHWHRAKDDSYEGAVVAFADYLSVVSYLLAETRSANFSIMADYDTMLKYSSTFAEERYDFIRPLSDEAVSLVEKMVEKVKSQQ